MSTRSAAPPGTRPGGVIRLYRELWHFARGAHRMLLGAFALLVGAQVLLLAIPYVGSRALNALQLQGAAGLGAAGGWLVLVLAVTAGSWLLHGPGRMLERNVALRVRERLTRTLLEQLLALPLAWHESHHSGATAHRVQQSSRALADFAQNQFIYLSSVVRLVGPVVALWLIDARVGLAAMTGCALISLAVVRFDRVMIRLAHRENEAERRYAAALIDSLGNTASLFALRQGPAVLGLLARRLHAVFEPVKHAILVNEAKWCTVDIASKALGCTLVALFAWLTVRHAPAAGGTPLLIGSVYMVWEYAQQAGSVVSAVAMHFQTLARQQADFASADPIRDAATAHFAAAAEPTVGGEWTRLEIRGLSFRHAASRGAAPTLDQVCLTLQRGKRYALVGSSGSGKSTLLRVLAGLYECERVTLAREDGLALVSPGQIARYLRATATLVPQDAEVFEGTLAENLAMCESVAGPVPAERFAAALELARASEFVGSGAAALELTLAERGANWSGGQRSRVALARGVLAAAGSSLVLLDEPTASLDPRTEALVYGNLFAAFGGACLVSSVHRLNLLDRFDEVLLMHEGRLVAQGTVDALLLAPELRQLLAAQRPNAGAAPDEPPSSSVAA